MASSHLHGLVDIGACTAGWEDGHGRTPGVVYYLVHFVSISAAQIVQKHKNHEFPPVMIYELR